MTMREHKWILDADRNPVPCPNLRVWATWFEDIKNRRVARTEFPDGSYLSTIFMGMDHGWNDKLPPVLFETMLFRPKEDEEGFEAGEFCERYATWAEAETGHMEFVEQCHVKDMMPAVLLAMTKGQT